ncbi:hypothetical protein ACRC6Q_09705 [Planococcus sp. SE5232]|uniref:hypothetical protein n=1 Tax=unclassified Planococcus (in: firmicutes) TaxID=2662419 RepID=UPI003D6AE50E
MKDMIGVIFVLLSFWGLSGCDSGSSEVVGPKNNESVNQKENFRLEILHAENSNASITYTGEEKEIDVNHAGTHFIYFNYYKDGEMLTTGTRIDMRSRATLIRNEPLVIDFDESELAEFEPGEFEIEAVAEFGVGEDLTEEVKYELFVSRTLSLLD